MLKVSNLEAEDEYRNWKKKQGERERKEDGNLRKWGALSPDAAIVADNGSGGEVLALAINVAHQMIIDVRLPRHFGKEIGWMLGFVDGRLLSLLLLLLFR